MFSFSSDAEPVERSTSDDDDNGASFAWRRSSVPDIDVGRRSAAPVVVTAGGDLVVARPNAEDDVDGTRARNPPVGDIAVERDARCRAVEGGGPIEPSTVRVGLTVVGVGTLLLVLVVLVGVVAVAFIRTLLPRVVTRAVVEDASEALPAFGASLLSSERRDAGRDV